MFKLPAREFAQALAAKDAVSSPNCTGGIGVMYDGRWIEKGSSNFMISACEAAGRQEQQLH